MSFNGRKSIVNAPETGATTAQKNRRAIRVLLLEDSPSDADLVEAQLRHDGFEPAVQRVVSKDEYVRNLSVEVDVILADHSLPQFDAISALRELKARDLDVPFLIVSGVISEEAAVQAMREGAADYLLKDRMTRLGQAVRRALDDRVARRRAAEERARHRRELEALVENSPDAILRFDREGRHLFANRAAERYLGLGREEIVGKTSADLPIPEATCRRWSTALEEVFESGARTAFTYALQTSLGERFFEVRLVPEKDEEDRFETVIAVSRDVTKRKRDEERLEESEQRWRSLVDRHPDAIIVTIDAQLVYANQAAADLCGMDAPEDAMGRSVFDFVSAEEHDLVQSRLYTLTRGRGTEAVRYRMIRLDGAVRHVEVHSVPTRYAGKAAVQSVIHDVTDRREYERTLIDARRRAEEIARLKSAILTNISHEVRTPLSTVLGFSDILRDHVDEEGKELLALILQSGERLYAMLTSILELARLEAEGLSYEAVEVDIEAEVDRVVESVRPQAQRKGLRLDWEPPADPVRAEVDPEVFARIIEHLLENAVKFTMEGRIAVRVTRQGDAACISVEDTGVGIRPHFLPRLFREFEQESKGLDRSFEGNGLGLAIVKRLVDLAGATISVESSPGRGSTFEVCFPRTPAVSL